VSHSHIRATPEPPPPLPQVAFGVFSRLAIFTCVVLAVAACLFLWYNYRNSTFFDRHQTVDGSVSDVRIAVDYPFDSGYGGRVVYKAEARVLFMAEGKPQNRWLPVAEPSTSTAWLRFQIPNPITKCIVYWVPGHLDNARCKLK